MRKGNIESDSIPRWASISVHAGYQQRGRRSKGEVRAKTERGSKINRGTLIWFDILFVFLLSVGVKKEMAMAKPRAKKAKAKGKVVKGNLVVKHTKVRTANLKAHVFTPATGVKGKKKGKALTIGMHRHEVTRTGCDGKFEVRKCKCDLMYTKMDKIVIAGTEYNRNHGKVTPSYADDGRYQCDGCCNFYHKTTKSKGRTHRGVREKVGFAWHCTHGFDLCWDCYVMNKY